jgi:hypothetical protein
MSDNVPLLRLYEFMRSMSGEERLELARWIIAKPELFSDGGPSTPTFSADEPKLGDLTRGDLAVDPALEVHCRDHPKPPAPVDHTRKAVLG